MTVCVVCVCVCVCVCGVCVLLQLGVHNIGTPLCDRRRMTVCVFVCVCVCPASTGNVQKYGTLAR